MKINWKWILPGLVAVFALMQFANPSRTNPPVVPGHDLLAANPPPPEIAASLRAACYDCHSHETRWPWYSHIAPVSWLVAGDVRDGSEEVGYRNMPPGKYTLLHPDARLNAAQRQALIDWADAAAARLKAAVTNN